MKALSAIYIRSKFADLLIDPTLDDDFIRNCPEYTEISSVFPLDKIIGWVAAKHTSGGSEHGSSMRYQYFFKTETTKPTQDTFPNEASFLALSSISPASLNLNTPETGDSTRILESFTLENENGSQFCLSSNRFVATEDGYGGSENIYTLQEYAESVVDEQIASASRNDTIFRDAYPNDPSNKDDINERTGGGYQRLFEQPKHHEKAWYDVDDKDDESGGWDLPNWPISVDPQWTGWQNEGGDGFKLNLKWTGF